MAFIVPSHRAVIESLESRQHLSVTLNTGVLRIVGTESSDQVAIGRDVNDTSRLSVSLNGVTTDYELEDIGQIRITTLGGDDDITFDHSSATGVRVKSAIYAGDGNDVIQGGMQRDRIYAGAGNDSISAGNGNDIVYGGDGDDTIVGGIGKDYLVGELGNDSLTGNAGWDRLFGNDGDDTLVGGDRKDTLQGGVGVDVYVSIGTSTDPDQDVQTGFAPASIAGQKLSGTVSVDVGPINQDADVDVTFNDNGTYNASIEAGPFDEDSTGTYTYTRTGPDTARVTINDNRSGKSGTIDLTFTAPNEGRFEIDSDDLGGNNEGRFRFG